MRRDDGQKSRCGVGPGASGRRVDYRPDRWEARSAAMAVVASACVAWAHSVVGEELRPHADTIAVADMIKFATVGDPEGGFDGQGYQTLQQWTDHRAEFSPDGSKVAIILRQADLATNTVSGEVMVFDTAELLSHPVGKRVARFVSSSNRPPIYQLRWLGDDRTLTAIGEYAGQFSQVYRIDTKSDMAVALTSAPLGVAAYATTPDGKEVAFLAPVPADPVKERQRMRHGYVITGEELYDAISEEVDQHQLHLFVQNASTGVAFEVPDPREVRPAGGAAGTAVRVGQCRDDAGISLSPDGRFVVRTCTVLRAPPRWREYRSSADATMAIGLRDSAPPNWRNQDVVFDLKEHIAFLAWDAPLPLTAWGRPMTWLPGPHTAVFANLALPLESTLHQRTHRSGVAIAMLDLATGERHVIRVGAPVLYIRWDGHGECLSLEVQTHRPSAAVCYRAIGETWKPVVGAHPIGPNSDGRISLAMEESLNSPPLLVARDSGTGQHVVLDPNPWIHGKRLGFVDPVSWEAKDGTVWTGGLYYPPSFVRGRRYPLVIQTHGFDPRRFSLYGSRTSTYAAQPLAAHDILVLQVKDQIKEAITDPSREGAAAQAGYESAIDYLDKRGLIDRDKVGIIGWSHSCFLVRYFLTHSHYKVAAAITSDGYDPGYMQFMAFAGMQPYIRRNIGVAPFDNSRGSWVDRWARESPDFRLDRVQAPVRVEALEGASSLIAQWAFYAGLRELHKPVELYYQPRGAHEAVLPLYWLGSAQGTVDWFLFWLKGEEARASVDSEQYERWSQLRALWKSELGEKRREE